MLTRISALCYIQSSRVSFTRPPHCKASAEKTKY
uniref:Uncharacterized protein n=1 Tax=Anguilla anguilla TaxID=7936 RepID=A0A0E9UTE5_ANGAN